jgi:hypothetical protein
MASKGPAAFPPEHVACGTRRRIEVLDKSKKRENRNEKERQERRRAEGEIKGLIASVR